MRLEWGLQCMAWAALHSMDALHGLCQKPKAAASAWDQALHPPGASPEQQARVNIPSSCKPAAAGASPSQPRPPAQPSVPERGDAALARHHHVLPVRHARPRVNRHHLIPACLCRAAAGERGAGDPRAGRCIAMALGRGSASSPAEGGTAAAGSSAHRMRRRSSCCGVSGGARRCTCGRRSTTRVR